MRVGPPLDTSVRTIHIVLAGDGIIRRGKGAGAQWVQTNGPAGCHITALAVSGSNIYAGTSYHGVFKSTDNGANWTEVNSGLPPDSEI